MDELLEEFINENIPRDLAKAYSKAKVAIKDIDSTNHPDTRHSEVGSSLRRGVRYDYANSTYEVMTPEEAIAYVKENPHNVENLRIIYKGELVELEYRQNGNKIYGIYANNDEPVTVDGKTYRNIRYLGWKKILEIADKIYKTDEYDHVISDDIINKRSNNAEQTIVRRNNGDGDPHHPARAYSDTNDIVINEPDTGSHNVRRRYALSRNNRKYIDALEEKQEAYIRYNNIRKALIKLQNEKDDYDEEEYNELYNEWSSKKEKYLKRYNDIAKECANAKSQAMLSMDDKSKQWNIKMYQYVQDVDNALTRCFDLSNELEKLSHSAVSVETGQVNDERRRIQDLIAKIRSLKTKIEQAQQQNSADLNELTSEKQSTESELADRLERLEQVQNEAINNARSQTKQLRDELKEAEAIYKQLRPKEAAAKAERAAKNKPAELDPSLTNIIDFVDFE